MNMKPRQLGIIIRSECGNEGKIVETVQLDTDESAINFESVWQCVSESIVNCWFDREKGSPGVILPGSVFLCLDRDMVPVSGLRDPEEITTEAPAGCEVLTS
jgi:hypothetical protein